jgi:hypothetical protein
MLKALAREQTKTTVIARKLKRSVAAVYLRAAVLRRPRRGDNSRGSKKLPAGACTEIGSAAHADWMRRASRISTGERPAGRGVEPCDDASSFRGARGERNTSGRLRRRRHGSQSTGMAERVKPRSREAVRHFPQGFTRDAGPGEDEWQQPSIAGYAISQQKAYEPQVKQVTCAKPATAGTRIKRYVRRLLPSGKS